MLNCHKYRLSLLFFRCLSGLTTEGWTAAYQAFWSTGDPTNLVIGQWVPGHPDITRGECVIQTQNPENLYPWELVPCDELRPFFCQVTACLSGKMALYQWTLMYLHKLTH